MVLFGARSYLYTLLFEIIWIALKSMESLRFLNAFLGKSFVLSKAAFIC